MTRKFFGKKPVKEKNYIPDKKQMGYFGVGGCVNLLNNPEMTSRMYTDWKI